MKKLNSRFRKVYAVLASILTLIAAITVSTASIFGFHQPKVPKYLK